MPPHPQHRENTPHPLGLTHAGYVEWCRECGIGSGKAAELYRSFYRDGDCSTWSSTRVAPISRTHAEECDEGEMTKFCQTVPGTDPSRPLDIESVIIPMEGTTGRKSTTLCVSSQVGCAMGCEFCETAQMGLIRSLTAEEIVGQWWAARHLRQTPIDGVVFMGMGEPLDNLDAVLESIECLTDRRGPCIPMAAVTISTVGRVDGLRRLVDVVQQDGWKRLGIALSINAPNDEVRNEIMPLNKKWGMGELREVMLEIASVRGKGRKMMFEYVLIPGVNDSADHAREIAEWMMPFAKRGGEDGVGGVGGRSHSGMLNVIPYNPRRDSPWPAPKESDVDTFVKQVGSHGVFVKRRRTKGRSQMAACGQLGTAEIRKRKFVGVTSSSEPVEGTQA